MVGGTIWWYKDFSLGHCSSSVRPPLSRFTRPFLSAHPHTQPRSRFSSSACWAFNRLAFSSRIKNFIFAASCGDAPGDAAVNATAAGLPPAAAVTGGGDALGFLVAASLGETPAAGRLAVAAAAAGAAAARTNRRCSCKSPSQRLQH